jgi:hypothetical protein
MRLNESVRRLTLKPLVDWECLNPGEGPDLEVINVLSRA